MLVTPEVFQLEMFTLMFLRRLKSWLMSVMPETSQVLGAPYVSSAVSGLESYASSAVLSLALSLKTLSSRRRWRVGGTGVAARSTHADRARPLLRLPSVTASACAGPVLKARSIGKNCGGTAPKRTRWRVVELGVNDSSLVPSSGPMSLSA